MEERRQHAPVDVVQALGAELPERVAEADVVEYLTKDELVDGKEERDARARGHIARHELHIRVEQQVLGHVAERRHGARCAHEHRGGGTR